MGYTKTSTNDKGEKHIQKVCTFYFVLMHRFNILCSSTPLMCDLLITFTLYLCAIPHSLPFLQYMTFPLALFQIAAVFGYHEHSNKGIINFHAIQSVSANFSSTPTKRSQKVLLSLLSSFQMSVHVAYNFSIFVSIRKIVKNPKLNMFGKLQQLNTPFQSFTVLFGIPSMLYGFYVSFTLYPLFRHSFRFMSKIRIRLCCYTVVVFGAVLLFFRSYFQHVL